MAIPQEIIDEVRDRTDIVEIVSSYIPLKRAGRNFKANCPFHSEKTASFIVSPDKQIYHCFGCGAGGGVIQFVMQYEHVGFPEAVEMLASRAGVEIPRFETPRMKAQESRKNTLYEVNAEAAAFYQNMLFSTQGKGAQTYLQGRGISNETAKIFGLGYAPAGRRALIDYLRARGISLDVLDAARLAVTTRDDSLIDMFRDRLMFPIYDVRKRVVGFGGRRLNDDPDIPKYINTPESPVYHKGSHLFGLQLAREHITSEEGCIVVEGNLDMIMPFQAGVTNIVASLGTALTVEQIRVLKRYTKEIVLMYDADSAGIRAALRAVDLLLEEEVNVRMARLPEGEDPDSYVRRHGAQRLQALAGEAEDFFSFKLSFLKKDIDIETAHGKNAIAAEMFETLARCSSPVARHEYIRQLAQTLQVPESVLYEEFRKVRHTPARHVAIAASVTKEEKIPFHEMYVLSAMLRDMTIAAGVHDICELDDFGNITVREIVKMVYELIDQGVAWSVRDLIEKAPEQLSAVIARCSINDEPVREDVLKESLGRVKASKKMRRYAELEDMLDKVEKDGGMIPPELMRERIALKRELDIIRKGEMPS
jgi:DNA primase